MPFRAMFATIVTVALALGAIALWVGTVGPILKDAKVVDAGIVATQPSTSPAQSLGLLVRGTMTLSFLLISFLLVVGFVATTREWAKVLMQRRAKTRRTKYVDAWKLAGERLETPGAEGPDGKDASS